MGSPSQVQDADSIQSANKKDITISDFTGGDDDLTNYILCLAKSEDDPPLLFDWDVDALAQFWHNAVAYGGPVAIPINGGVNLAGAVNINLLRSEILSFVREGAGNPVAPNTYSSIY